MYHTPMVHTSSALAFFDLLLTMPPPPPQQTQTGPLSRWWGIRVDQVTLGVPASEICSARNFPASPRTVGHQAGRAWRLSEHVPDPRLTIRLRCEEGCVCVLGRGAVVGVFGVHFVLVWGGGW